MAAWDSGMVDKEEAQGSGVVVEGSQRDFPRGDSLGKEAEEG